MGSMGDGQSWHDPLTTCHSVCLSTVIQSNSDSCKTNGWSRRLSNRRNFDAFFVALCHMRQGPRTPKKVDQRKNYTETRYVRIP